MKLREQQREQIQHEMNRLNDELNSMKLSPNEFRRRNRRRSELIATSKRLKLDVRTV